MRDIFCRKWILAFSLIGLIVTSGGCEKLYQLLHKEGAEEKEVIGESDPLEANPPVEQIQNLLQFYGYHSGEIDGVLGPRTRRAIADFQKDHGLEVTRFVDRNTWEKLGAFQQTGLMVNGQLNVELVQNILQEQGFNPGSTDGKLGPKTQEAIRNFQQAHSLKVDGKIGYETLMQLSQYLPDNKSVQDSSVDNESPVQ
jgi:peptidoglycan hydrolase-like protein with peptidoglycan-binding domain